MSITESGKSLNVWYYHQNMRGQYPEPDADKKKNNCQRFNQGRNKAPWYRQAHLSKQQRHRRHTHMQVWDGEESHLTCSFTAITKQFSSDSSALKTVNRFSDMVHNLQWGDAANKIHYHTSQGPTSVHSWTTSDRSPRSRIAA